jgi:creatinine amidohydrolase
MKLADLKWPNVEALSRDTSVIIPIAAHEQHGRHMPLHTDSLLLGEVVRRAEELLGDDALFAPLMWLGNSHHHLDFPGTLSAEPRVYLDLLNGLLENFLHHGFKRLVLLNGHGGNIVPGAQAVFETRQRHRDRTDLLLLSATYWDQAKIPGAHADLVQDAMGHAGELETSMMLVIRPELVDDYAATDEVPQGKAFATATRGWITQDRSAPGHIGVPAGANAEKGETLFSIFTEGAVKLIGEMRDWDGQSWDGSTRAA